MLDTSHAKYELSELGLSVDLDADPSFDSRVEALKHFETRRLMRIAFYDAVGRRPPTCAAHLSSYVRSVKKHWNLKFSNSARRLIANIEGYRTWEEAISSD